VSDGVYADAEVVALHVRLQVSPLGLCVRRSLSRLWLHILAMSLADAYQLCCPVIGANIAYFTSWLELCILFGSVFTILARVSWSTHAMGIGCP
jgi:hypothetical protein